MAEDLERYNSPLTGAEVDVALQDMAQRISERYAKGTANDVPVTTGQIGYQDNAKYYANLAQSAVPAGVEGAVLWSQNQLLTDEQKAVARTNIGATATNPNLLDNPWFTVNQRGATTYNTRGYSLDRWKLYENNASSSSVVLTTTTDGVKLEKTVASYGGRLSQKLDDIQRLLGKTVTLSVQYKSTIPVQFALATTETGTLDVGGTTLAASSDWKIATLQIDVPTTISNLWVVCAILNATALGTIEIKAIKLELGSVSTLANDIAPNYAEELAKCQRYYVRFSGNASHLGSGFFTSNSAVQIDIPLPTTMAQIKDVSNALSGTAYIWTTSHIGSGALATTVGGTGRVANNIASFQFSVSGTAGQPALLQLRDKTSYIEISCDL